MLFLIKLFLCSQLPANDNLQIDDSNSLPITVYSVTDSEKNLFYYTKQGDDSKTFFCVESSPNTNSLYLQNYSFLQKHENYFITVYPVNDQRNDLLKTPTNYAFKFFDYKDVETSIYKKLFNKIKMDFTEQNGILYVSYDLLKDQPSSLKFNYITAEENINKWHFCVMNIHNFLLPSLIKEIGVLSLSYKNKEFITGRLKFIESVVDEILNAQAKKVEKVMISHYIIEYNHRVINKLESLIYKISTLSILTGVNLHLTTLNIKDKNLYNSIQEKIKILKLNFLNLLEGFDQLKESVIKMNSIFKQLSSIN